MNELTEEIEDKEIRLAFLPLVMANLPIYELGNNNRTREGNCENAARVTVNLYFRGKFSHRFKSLPVSFRSIWESQNGTN